MHSTGSSGVLSAPMDVRSSDSMSVKLIQVKPFVPDDWPALWAIRTAQLAEHGVLLDSTTAIPEYPPQPGIDDRHEWDLCHINLVYLCGAGNFWLARYTGHPVGYVGGQDVGGAIELRRMYVKAGYRRRGVASRLVEALVSHSRAQGIHAIELWTAADGPGRQLYRSLGFRKTEGPGVEYNDVAALTRYTPGADEIRMRLDL